MEEKALSTQLETQVDWVYSEEDGSSGDGMPVVWKDRDHAMTTRDDSIEAVRLIVEDNKKRRAAREAMWEAWDEEIAAMIGNEDRDALYADLAYVGSNTPPAVIVFTVLGYFNNIAE